ncbi:replication initiator protein [Capybara microvirus Cap3_SP_469]|nr:replication initiator protein [Capybara microvirus Cap3_SP_469]
MCTSPLKGFPYGKTKNGKDNFVITSYKCDHIEVNRNDVPIKIYEPTFIHSQDTKEIIRDFIEIPCGHCLECRLDYSRQWANRCMLEAQSYKHNYFVTLTYDDLHLPMNEYVDVDGVLQLSPTLVKRDLQLFMKRLRKKFGDNIRFYACGEYGSKTHRPHYHLILFNFNPNDLIFLKQNFQGDLYYTSPGLESCWKYGYSMIAEVNWNTCAYVARYIVKKQFGENADYKKFNYEPEFTLMSRKPGIARDWYENHKDNLYDYDAIYIKDGIPVKPSKYFDRLYDIDYSAQMEEIKKVRLESMLHHKMLIAEMTSQTYEEQLSTRNNVIEEKTKKLKRKEI